MGRYRCYEPNTISFLCLSLWFLFCPMVLSALSQTQTNTMTTISALLNGTVSSWNIDKNPNPCTWKGVKCDNGNSSVTKVSLSRLGLSSSQFLPVLCQIDTLQQIDVSDNRLSLIPPEFISDCRRIEGLKLLNFSKNRLVGSLPTFGRFIGLEFLDMSFNQFTGSIDFQFAELVSLKSLNLRSNGFNGSIPTNLGKSMALEELVLSMNQFGDKIPHEILDYKNLTLIDLSVNHLTGSVPNDIGQLSKLKFLILSSNELSGKIPTTFSDITTLVRFAANQNQFTGAVPQGITKFLRNLDLSYNNLSEPIPADLFSPSSLQLVDLSYNKLVGTLPANISRSLVRLRLGNNSLSGTIPSATWATLQNLMYLELEGNKLTGRIPSELGSCRKLALLSLAQNSLTGQLPAELGNLSNLQALKVQVNKLVGPIPIQITQLNKLQTLNLSWNSFSGSIPSGISSLNSLTNLYLQGNHLSGFIPSSISQMKSLMELQLGHNQLNGTIPSLPLNLQIALNLSSNLFEGPIPETVNLYNLEVLDLSNNRFSGEIPDFLTKMPALTQLVLSNNELSGLIPKFKAWVNVDTNGNSHLINTTSNTSQQLAKKGKSVAVAILIPIAAAVFVVGLVALLSVSISRRYYRVNDEHLQSGEDLHLPYVIIQGNLLTPNGIHRSNIDFSKAMEAVTDTSNVTLKTRFSTYYRAIMPSGAIYFVKKLNWSDKIFSEASRDKFGKGLEVLAKLNNSNVMTPLAYVLSTEGTYILYEFISNGSLYDVLHGSMGYTLDWASRYSIAIGVAQGLSFLHGYASGPILLLDLSSKCIMLKSFKEPLVGDIELYKVIDPTKSTGSLSAVAGSVGYIPPEYAYTMRVTTAGNVYSFGVILLELLTGKPAVTEGTELVKWVSRNSTKPDHILDFNVSRASQAVRNQMLATLKVALACVGTSPESRPKMKSVLRMLLNAR